MELTEEEIKSKRRLYDRNYRIKNLDKKRKYDKERNKLDHRKDRSIKHYAKNKEKVKEKRKVYYSKNKEICLNNSKIYYQTNKEKVDKSNKEYRANNEKKLKDAAKKWVKENPNKVENARLKHCFGINLDEYNKMLIDQNNSCIGCGKNKDQFKRKLAVDHCHKTGKIRGLLCHKCNITIGLLDENINTLKNLVLYLEKHQY